MSKRFWACMSAGCAATWMSPDSGSFWLDFFRDMPLNALVVAAVYFTIGAIRETPATKAG